MDEPEKKVDGVAEECTACPVYKYGVKQGIRPVIQHYICALYNCETWYKGLKK